MRQGRRNVTEFFTELRTLWEELESLRPTPDCVCKIKYSSALIKSVVKHRESEYVLCFWKGLNDSYVTVKTQILLMEPLPNVNRIFSLVIQQERQLTRNAMVNSKILLNT